MLAADIMERAAAQNLADYVTAFNAVAPGVKAAALEIGGGIAAFTGIDSPLSTIKGAGSAVTDNDIDAAERFFRAQGAGQVTFELAPWADGPSVERLQRRGYRAAGSESVVVRAVSPEAPASDFRVQLLEAAPWAELALEVSELPRQESSKVLTRAAAHLGDALNLAVQEEAGAFVACAQLAPAGGVAIFGNDNTDPRARARLPATAHRGAAASRAPAGSDARHR